MKQIVEIDLREILWACLRKAWLIILCAVVLGAAVYAYTTIWVTPLYQAGATFYVNNSVHSSSDKISSADLATSQRLVLTYVNIIKSDRVLEKIIAETDLNLTPDALRGMMTAESIDDTEMFTVKISHTDPELAAGIANAVADVAPAQIAEIMEGSTTKVVDRAKVPAAPYTPNRGRNALLGALVGMVLAVIYIVLRVLMDVRVKDEQDLAAISQAPVLGVIPTFSDDARDSKKAGKIGMR